MSRFFRVRILAGDNAVELLNINGMSDTVEWVSKIADAEKSTHSLTSKKVSATIHAHVCKISCP